MTKRLPMKTLACQCSIAGITVFVWASVCAAQQMDRLVDWQSVVPGSNASVPLEIVGIKINETPVAMGKSFTADEDWLDKVTFIIRNTSDKTISAFWFNVAFPGTNLGRKGYAGIGILFDATKDSDQDKRILPGRAVDVTLAVGLLSAIKHDPQRLQTHVTTLNLVSWFTIFEDGSRLSGTSLRKP